jgi:hypothetical protein
MADECSRAADKALWDTDGPSISAWANEGLSMKYKMLSALARSQGMHAFRVLADVETSKIIAVGPVPVVNGYSGRTDYKWRVDHVPRGDRQVKQLYVPYAPKRPSTLMKYGFKEVWAVLPGTVGTKAASFNEAKHYAAGASHVYKIKDQALYDLQLDERVIDQYKQGFGKVFTSVEQDHVLRSHLTRAELELATV